MFGSNCCFLTFLQVSQETGNVVYYSYLLKNLPQFVVIHIVKGIHRVNEAEIGVFVVVVCLFVFRITLFSLQAKDFGNLISGYFALSKLSLYIWKSQFIHY